MADEEKPYTTGEVAEMSHVTINAVKKWISSGKLKAFRTPGGHFRINRDDFKEFVERFRFQIKEEVFPDRHKILIADDSAETVEFLTRILKDRYGDMCIIESAVDGYDTLIKVGSFRPELLILDIRMPRIDGIEACRRLRSDAELRRTKILAVSAFGKEELSRIKAAGADVCQPKPVNTENFLSAVALLLGTGRSQAAS